MRKIQNVALIKSVEISDALASYNMSNNTCRARLVFAYDGGADTGSDDVMALLTTLTNTNQYSLIINLDNLPGAEGKSDEEKLMMAQEQLVGKKCMFTTYIFPIAELNEEGETQVHNANNRVYTSFSNSYLGTFDDDNAALGSIKSRLERGIENAEYEYGDVPAAQPQQQQQRPMGNNRPMMRNH